MDNEEYFITTQLSNLNENNKHGFLLLTKYIIKLQQQGKFNVLNMEHEHTVNMFANYPAADIGPHNYRDIYRLYEQAELFEEIKKGINKKTKINKKLSPILRNYIEDTEEQDNFKQFMNIIVICNLIKQQLKNKSQEDITHYGLFDKLSAVNPNMVTWLNLGQVTNLNTKEEMNCWLNDVYTYDNMHIPQVVDLINEEDYNAIYHIFSRFVSLKQK